MQDLEPDVALVIVDAAEVGQEARIVQQSLEGAETGSDGFRHLEIVIGRGAGKIHGIDRGFGIAVAGDLVVNSFHGRHILVEQHDRRTGSRVTLADGTADAVARTGDENGFVCECCHGMVSGH